MSIHRASVAQAIAFAVLTVLGWLGGCSDNPGSPGDPPALPEGLIVSDPVTTAGLATGAGVVWALAGSAADDVAYVSLAPGTVPTGTRASVHRVGDVATLTTAVINGGFDPIPVGAQAGNFIDVVVRDAGGGTLFQQRVAVRPGRRPSVVRTQPGRGKTDVPMNAAIIVVFSEPVAGATLTPSSVRLLRGTTPVAGTVRLLEGTGAVGVFTPATPLNRNANYRLVVTQAVQDLDGDALEAGLTVAFMTGQSSTGPAASITVSPDTVRMTGATYQMTATVRDAAGNELIDQPVMWATSDLTGLMVSPTGLLTALATGSYDVVATTESGSLSAAARVIVTEAPASVDLSPTPATVAAGDTIMLMATVRNAAGNVLLEYPPLIWTSSAPDVATAAASAYGLAWATVTGVNPGSVTITATSGAASGTASVAVTPPRPVASVTVTPGAATLVLQGTVQLSATLSDAQGKVIDGRAIAWASDNTVAATVDASGLVTGIAVGSAIVSATSEGVTGTAAITVTAIRFVSMSAGAVHTCGVTTTGAAYCWGGNPGGQLGTGSTSYSTVPVAVTGGLTFSVVTTGGGHTCGLTTNGAAYCWGPNDVGQLGDGSTDNRLAPVAVIGGLTFSVLTAGTRYTCGLATDEAAYCWGNAFYGQLGTGSTGSSTVPVAVTGGLAFAALAAGRIHTCGVTTTGAAYCWGDNRVGQLGDGSTDNRLAPVAVIGGLTFSALTAGEAHTCGVTPTGAGYCWGHNNDGQLGAGSTTPSLVPVAVAGGLTFSALTAGELHACGLTTTGAAYCWGNSSWGQLGNGSTTGPDVCAQGLVVPCSQTPVAVTGGLTFSMLTAGSFHTCGLATDGAAYCWGRAGGDGYPLGNGSTTGSTVPVKVAGQP